MHNETVKLDARIDAAIALLACEQAQEDKIVLRKNMSGDHFFRRTSASSRDVDII